MSRARMEIDHAERAAYIDFGVDARGVGAAVEVSPTVTVDLDPSGAGVGVELPLIPGSVSVDELCAKGAFRDDDARLLKANLPAILTFLAGGPDTPANPAAPTVDYVYLVT